MFLFVDQHRCHHTYKLTVSGGSINLQVPAGSLKFNVGTTNAFAIESNGANGYLKIRDTYNSADRIYIKHDGNVGIGTTSPARPLSVNSTQISARFTSSSADSQIELTDSSGTAVLGSSSGAFLVQTGSATRLTISTSGDVSLESATSLDFNVADFAQIKFKESGAITIDSDNNQSSRNFQIKDGSGSSLLTVLDTAK